MADGGRLDTRAEKRPAKPAVKLPTIVGHNTATRSLFNRTWPSTEKGLRGLGGIKKGQKRRLGLLDKGGSERRERKEMQNQESIFIFFFRVSSL